MGFQTVTVPWAFLCLTIFFQFTSGLAAILHKRDVDNFPIFRKVFRRDVNGTDSRKCISSTLVALNTHYLAVPCSLKKEEASAKLHEKIHNKWTLPTSVNADDVAFSKQGIAIIKVVNERINGLATCILTRGKNKRKYHHHILAYDLPKYRFETRLAFATPSCSLNDEDIQAKIKLVKDVSCPTNDKLCQREVDGQCEEDDLLVISVYGRKFPVRTKGRCNIQCGSTRAIAKATSSMDFLLQEFNGAHVKNSGSTKLVFNKDKTKASVHVICENGYMFHDELNFCLPCPPGKFSIDGTKCEPCHIGEYQHQYGSSICQICPTGSKIAYKGAKSKEECSASEVKVGEETPPSCEYWEQSKAEKYVKSSTFSDNSDGTSNKDKSEKLSRLKKKYQRFYRRLIKAKRPSVAEMLKKRVESIRKQITSLGGQVPYVSKKMNDKPESSNSSSDKIKRDKANTFGVTGLKNKMSDLQMKLETLFKQGQDGSKYTFKHRDLIKKKYQWMNKKINRIKRKLKRTENNEKIAKSISFLKSISRRIKSLEKGIENMKRMMLKMSPATGTMASTKTGIVAPFKDSSVSSGSTINKLLDQVKTKKLRGRMIRYGKARVRVKIVLKKWQETKQNLEQAVYLSPDLKKTLKRHLIQLAKNLMFPKNTLSSLTNIQDENQYQKLVKIEKILGFVRHKLDTINLKIRKKNYPTTRPPAVHKDAARKMKKYDKELPRLLKDLGLSRDETTKSAWEKQLDEEVSATVGSHTKEVLANKDINELLEESETSESDADDQDMKLKVWTILGGIIGGLLLLILICVCTPILVHYCRRKEQVPKGVFSSTTLESKPLTGLDSRTQVSTSDRPLSIPYGQLM